LSQFCKNCLALDDALRLRFARGESGWLHSPTHEAAPFNYGRRYLQMNEKPAFQTAATQLQASLNLPEGHYFVLPYLDSWANISQTFVIGAIHHLAVDGVSWRILHLRISRRFMRAD